MSRIFGVLLVGFLLVSVNSYEVVDCNICPQQSYSQHPYHPPSQVHGQKGCTKFGKTFQEGERYHRNHLWYLCKNGIMSCKGCYYNETKELNVNENYIDHKTNTSFRCYGKDNTIGYREITCGNMGFNADYTACNTVYIPPISNHANYGCDTCEKPTTGTQAFTPTYKKPLVHQETRAYEKPLVQQTTSTYEKPIQQHGGYQIEKGGYQQREHQQGDSQTGVYQQGYHPRLGNQPQIERSGYEQGEASQQKTHQQSGRHHQESKAPYQQNHVQQKDTRCTKDGQFFHEGEVYRHNHLWYKCENGILIVKGCYLNNKDLSPGQHFVDHEAKSILFCYKNGTRTGYKLKLCTGTGFNEALTDCKGTAPNSGHTYNEVAHHKVYVNKNEVGEHKVDEEKAMHVDCNCYN